jgi:transcriptional regulator with XRE-family HTH domain
MNNDLAKLVRRARKAKGLTQEEFAEAISKSLGYVGQLETGKVDRPFPETLRSISAVLGLSLDQLAVATGQLDRPDVDVEPDRMLLLLDAMPTAEARLAAYRQLPAGVRRGIRKLMRDLLLEEAERLEE